MKLLHTSDWHLGRLLLTDSLVEHQRTFLTWLAGLAREREVAAIVVSGDVYDRAVPSVDAVRLLEAGLVELVHVCPVILISGNHDSPTRLGFGGELFEAVDIHLRSSVADISRAVELTTDDGECVVVYGVPYLEPEVTRAALGADKSHEAVLTAAMGLIRADLDVRCLGAAVSGTPAPRSVVLAHAFITGGEPSDSERDVSVGGIAEAGAAVFDGVDYVALGHLHGAQGVGGGGRPTVRYSGSPIAYSFSEEKHVKSVTVVDIRADGRVEVEVVPTPVPRPLRTVTGDLDDLLSDVALSECEGSWVRAILTDPRRPENAMERLRTRFPHTLELSWLPHLDGRPVADVVRRVDPVTSSPVEVVAGFIEHVTGTPATADEVRLAERSVERMRIVEASS